MLYFDTFLLISLINNIINIFSIFYVIIEILAKLFVKTGRKATGLL